MNTRLTTLNTHYTNLKPSAFVPKSECGYIQNNKTRQKCLRGELVNHALLQNKINEYHAACNNMSGYIPNKRNNTWYRHAKCSEMKKITESEAFRLAALAGKCYGLRESFRDKYIYQSDRNHEYEIDAAKDINSDCEIHGNNIKKAKEEAAREKATREKAAEDANKATEKAIKNTQKNRKRRQTRKQHEKEQKQAISSATEAIESNSTETTEAESKSHKAVKTSIEAETIESQAESKSTDAVKGTSKKGKNLEISKEKEEIRKQEKNKMKQKEDSRKN